MKDGQNQGIWPRRRWHPNINYIVGLSMIMYGFGKRGRNKESGRKGLISKWQLNHRFKYDYVRVYKGDQNKESGHRGADTEISPKSYV